MATIASNAESDGRWIRVWDLPVRLFHWALVIAIAAAFLSSEEEGPLDQWHMVAGWVAAVLLVFRLVWGFIGGEHSRFADFIRPSRIGQHVAALMHGEREATLGHNPLGAVSVLVLLALVALTVGSGAFDGEASEDLHEALAWVLLALVGLHVAAVIVMSLIERENLVRAMVTGKKPASRHPGGADARRPGPIAIALAFVAIVATVILVLQYDPQAFTPRNAEAVERAGNASGSMDSHKSHEDD